MSTTVRHSLHGVWSQSDLGDAFDVQTLSQIAELDPTGISGVVMEVLGTFQVSLEAALVSMEADARAPDAAQRLCANAHGIRGAASQIGALRLAAACLNLEKLALSPRVSRGALTAAAEDVICEVIRVQRRLHFLLPRQGADSS
jgi:HPt (histidine-containing phosphotransfer) domain-containing protein